MVKKTKAQHQAEYANNLLLYAVALDNDQCNDCEMDDYSCKDMLVVVRFFIGKSKYMFAVCSFARRVDDDTSRE